MGTALVGAHTLGHLMGAEQARWLDNRALTVHPSGFDGIEPGTLDRQVADDDAHAVAVPCARVVMGPNPGAPAPPNVPGEVSPEQHPDRTPPPPQFAPAPSQELGSEGTDRPPP